MRSVADNQTAALSLGVHVRRVFALSWAIAAVVCAMSGILLGIMNGINVHQLSEVGLKVFPVVILGGLGNTYGAVLGAFLLVLLPEVLREVQLYRMLILGIGLVLLMRFRPQGLLGVK